MARIKLAYIGGGSTRAPGTVASFIHQGKNFQGSEVVLIDLNEERLKLVKTISDKIAKAANMDITISTTTNRREGLKDCDAVLTSFRPGGFEARHLDESIPLKYDIIGNETQAPGGFFMALRVVHVMKSILKDIQDVCPNARVFNYTNPINLVSQALTKNTSIPVLSLCEGPIYFARDLALAADLDPNKLDSAMIGLNHASWSVRHIYDGQDFMPLVKEAYERKKEDSSVPILERRMLKLASIMNAIPADYFQYYYFKDEILAELKAKPTSRAQDIMQWSLDYWQHYNEEAQKDRPKLDPERSRGGIFELELAFDLMDAIFNDKAEVWPVNMPNNGAIKDFPDDLVVECPGFANKNGVQLLSQGHMPRHLVGLIKMLGEYQALAGEAAWSGTRIDAIRALASHPLVFSIVKAEKIYDELAAVHKDYLPERLLS